MRMYLLCNKCFWEFGPPVSGAPSIWVAAHLEDSGLYRMTCPRGHETVVCLQEMKFEILFDLGAYAIIDGYHREAVASFASALERFYEFYIRIQCDRSNVPAAVFEQAWKSVSNQSERQLGAFMFTYLMENKALAPVLSNEVAKFRNAVIHKGKIPSREEAIDFGERCAEIILPVLSVLRSDAPHYLNQAVGRYVSQLMQKVTVPDVSTMSSVTMISIGRATSEPQPSLREWLVQLEQRRRLMGTLTQGS
jgi:hypothetical protein